MKILLVEDSHADQFLFKELLKETSFFNAELFVASRMDNAIDVLNGQSMSVIFLDLSLPDSFGTEGVVTIRAKDSGAAIIVLTGLKNDEMALKALEHGAQDYLVKGEYDGNSLDRSIKYSMERQKVIRQRQIAELAFHEGQELERARISREIHDGLGQMLVLTKMRVERLADTSKDQVDELKEVKELLDSIILEARGISENIVPSVLKELGLAAAISHMCMDVRKNSGFNINEDLTEIKDFSSVALASGLYRIIQEALNNAVKHSEGSNVDISLNVDSSHITLVISDDGKGIPENYVAGNGIKNIKDRVLILDGTISFENPAKGTTIKISIPIQKNGKV